MVNRRAFIKGSGLSMLSIGLAGMPGFLARAAGTGKVIAPYKKTKTLVFIFQRGAMDGLMAVTPFTDAYLQQARPTLFMSAARNGTGTSLIDLDGRFGMHPSLSAFEPLFRDNRLAVVHGMGSPNSTRSHFDAQDYMESGTPFSKGTPSGWLNRAAAQMGKPGSPFAAVSLTSSLPRSFYGDFPALAINNLNDFAIQAKANPAVANLAARSFEELYDQASSSLLNRNGRESFDAMHILEKTDTRRYVPANGALYPQSPLGNALKQIAQLIKMDVGLEIAFTESGGWDTHFNQGTDSGIFARNVKDLSGSIAAFWTDLGTYQDDVTLMTSTEFGRTVKQNGTGGTDHGRASCCFVLGHDVKGGQVHGLVKPLSPDNLADGRDLAVTTDFRSVFSEVAEKHLQITKGAPLFPDWDGKGIGVMRSSRDA
jgi:uncharacterized protein (DUF1501 family)